jgi:tetratricopeptide (TPR) repeat protein
MGALKIILILALSTLRLNAASTEEAFDAANRLYAQGRFAEAAEAYQRLIQSGTATPALWFNLGNAHFKSGSTGKAIVALERSKSLAPRDPDVQADLKYIRAQIRGPNYVPGRWERGLQRLSLNEWALVFFVLWWLFLLSISFLQLFRRWVSMLRKIAWASGLALVIAGMCLAAVWHYQSAPRVVVIAEEAPVRNSPLEESQSAFTLYDGAELLVLDKKNDWLQIEVNGQMGWIARQQVTPLNSDTFNEKPAAAL